MTSTFKFISSFFKSTQITNSYKIKEGLLSRSQMVSIRNKTLHRVLLVKNNRIRPKHSHLLYKTTAYKIFLQFPHSVHEYPQKQANRRKNQHLFEQFVSKNFKPEKFHWKTLAKSHFRTKYAGSQCPLQKDVTIFLTQSKKGKIQGTWSRLTARCAPAP